MTEEATQQATQTPEDNGVNISVEQILAAIVATVGEVNIPLEVLVANYSTKSISVNQNEDKSVTFSLVDGVPADTQTESAE
jgi:hypothetical protein